MTTDQRCYALNRDGRRCEEAPGHGGFHRISIEWDDSDLFDPTSVVSVVEYAHPVELTPLQVEHLVDMPAPSTNCVICQHDHRSMGECRVEDCDCKAPIS